MLTCPWLPLYTLPFLPRNLPEGQALKRASNAPEACTSNCVSLGQWAHSPEHHPMRTNKKRYLRRRPSTHSQTNRQRPGMPQAQAQGTPGQNSHWGPHRSPRALTSYGDPRETGSGKFPCGAELYALMGGTTAAMWDSEAGKQRTWGVLGTRLS